MKLRLFHKIGEDGAESAAVRQFLVENSLESMVEFSNVAYETAQQDLLEAAGAGAVAPVLLVDKKPVIGKSLIIDWFKTNVLCLRD